MAAALFTVLAPLIGDIVNRVLPADANKAGEIEREIRLSLLENEEKLENMRGQIVLAEANSGSWLTSTWRPLLMMVIVSIIALNYLIFPLISLTLGVPLEIDLPSELWTLLNIGVGGYVVGRSGEKITETLSGRQE